MGIENPPSGTSPNGHEKPAELWQQVGEDSLRQHLDLPPFFREQTLRTEDSQRPKHIIGIVGASSAGTEMAIQLAQTGMFEVVVFDESDTPFGKVRKGLPDWHRGIKKKEYSRMLTNLSGRFSRQEDRDGKREKIDQYHPNVHFVPNTRVGTPSTAGDVSISELLSMGFSYVILANGAKKDRPLTAQGVSLAEHDGHGFRVQNPHMEDFNQWGEEGKAWETYDLQDTENGKPRPGAVFVFGGGLASLDVVKTYTVTAVYKKLIEMKERGSIDSAMDEVNFGHMAEKKGGVRKVLETLGISYDTLKLPRVQLVYRKARRDMPWISAPKIEVDLENKVRLLQASLALEAKSAIKTPEKTDALQAELAHAQEELQRKQQERKDKVDAMVKRNEDDYFFTVMEHATLEGVQIDNGRVVGVELRRKHVRRGRVTGETYRVDRRSRIIYSSIGSVAEPIVVHRKRYHMHNFEPGQTRADDPLWTLQKVAGIGNVFGTGNINDSIADTKESASLVINTLANRPTPEASTYQKILRFVQNRQQAVGYDGNLIGWIMKKIPRAFLEDIGWVLSPPEEQMLTDGGAVFATSPRPNGKGAHPIPLRVEKG